ncbi:MAG: Ribonuclease D [Steroidobacteraceae bacterium]|nr:Ribonuclease D [Steroidobacteraceae bacterium]
MTTTTALITGAGALAELGAELTAAPAIGLDTEFMRERTYRAELCLLQVASAGRAACVDPLALESLAPLAAALGPGGPVKVLHAARQDLEVLSAAIGRVEPVFDTQVAAALAGFASQVGYADLVRQLLGHDLPKAHTRTDWSRRPLSPDQLEYALDDVCHLLALRDCLLERLDRQGRLAWLDEELQAIADPQDFIVDPERAWQRLKGVHALDAGRQRLAKALAAWRERRAIERNRPRGWILDDAALKEIVAEVPRDPAALAATAGLPAGVAQHSGAELLALVQGADVPDPPPPLPRRGRPDAALTNAVKRLAEVTRQAAAETGIGAEVLAPRRELERLAAGDHTIAALRGWRLGVVGERLLDSLQSGAGTSQP